MFLLLAQAVDDSAAVAAQTTIVPNPSLPDSQGVWSDFIPRILPACAEKIGGCSSLADLMQVFVNISEIVLGLTGIVLLGVFVYAGFLYVLSRGEAEKISKVHTMWQNSIIGLLIVLCAYTVISYGVASLVNGEASPSGSYQAICTGAPEGSSCGPSATCQSGACVSTIPSVPPTP